MSLPNQPKTAHLAVGILLCTYNGAAYLREQLDSITAQTHLNWHLFVSDDGSTDHTLDILAEYEQRAELRITVFEGPKRGFAQNFLSLIRNKTIRCNAYAFSDQDDIWLPDKLERSLRQLISGDTAGPFLYCSRTRLIDAQGNASGLSPLFIKAPSFNNALVQSLAGANTMLINESARALLARADIDTPIVAHDWLAYMVVSGCGGRIVYDPAPTLLYRQHEGNLIGANSGVHKRIVRVSKMLSGRFRDWNEKNLMILRKYSPELTPENELLMGQFDRLRHSDLCARIAILRKMRLYRQTRPGTISLYLAVLLKKI